MMLRGHSIRGFAQSRRIRASREMSMDCMALLIDMHSNIEQTFIPNCVQWKRDKLPQPWHKKTGGFTFS